MKKFLIENPVSSSFLKREKGKLPYSVFKATADEVKFLESKFKGRPPTVYFPYPSYVHINKSQFHNMDLVKSYNRRGDIESLFMSFYNSDRTHIYNAVVNTMKNGGFEMIERAANFNLVWTGYSSAEDMLVLNKYQKINHFPNSMHLGRKDWFWDNVHRMKLKFPAHFNVTPHSWVLSRDFEQFDMVKQQRAMQQKFFILKPSNSSCGRGIKVVHGSSTIPSQEDTIVSTYLERPLLINKKKFDIRMYVLVTSYNPLRIYFYDEGLVRFATEDYSNDPKVLRNKFVHLTNFSINKRNTKAYVRNDSKTGSKNKGQLEEDEEENQ